MSDELKEHVAVVTGASRGVGRGVALALGDAGMTVVVTGRTLEAAGAGLSLSATADEVTARGGRGIAMRCDHTKDDEVRDVFRRVEAELGRLDVLVNNVFQIPSEPMWGVPFWQQSIAMWDQMHSVGLRSHYVASVFAAPLMVRQKRGLIANISSFGGAGFQLNVAYGVGKAGVDRLARDMAHDLKPHGIATLSLWPGVVRTEYILAQREHLPFPIDVSESPEFTGRAVAALAKDPMLMEKTGQVLVVAELAAEYGFTDVDGSRPPSLRAQQRKDPA
jgi:dehydrogenase/reductase SDR family protein 1